MSAIESSLPNEATKPDKGPFILHDELDQCEIDLSQKQSECECERLNMN